MDFKLVSKNNMGAIATLILVILLSQARFFDFLIDTVLGRAFLILFILGISYTNHILGVVAVLFIIIIFNQSDIGYIEGFNSGNSTNNKLADDKLKLKDKKDKKDKDKKDKNTQNKIKQNMQQTTTTTSSTVSATPLTKATETFVGREGFNMIDREGTMLRGKRSNEVPVFSSSRNQSDDVEPIDKSVFTNSFSSI
jgi:hypothetical protein